MATFPNDQFDNLPENVDRVGAHRGPKVRGRGWIGFGWAVLAVVVLIGAGVIVLNVLSSGGFTGTLPTGSATPTSTPTPTISPITDPTTIKARHITVSVLNGTATPNLQKIAAFKLKKVHWNVTSSAVAGTSTFKETTVYYSKSTNKDVALGIAQALGFSRVAFVDANTYPGAVITVVLGSDYKG